MSSTCRNPALIAVGSILLLDAWLVRLLFRADETRVWILGRPIEWVCGFRQALGLPCPTCGLTRSIVLSLHGELGRAWSIAPVGPLIASALVVFGVALVVLGAVTPHAIRHSWIQRSAWVYGSIIAAAWIGGWVINFSTSL